jgi:hypothetical protein
MRSMAVWALAILLATPLSGLGQTDGTKKPETARFGNPTTVARQLQDLFYGVIKSLDKKEMVLEKTKFGLDQTIRLNEKTKYVHDGEPSTLDRLKVGDQVWLQIKNDKKTGDMIAEKVLSGVIGPTIRK